MKGIKFDITIKRFHPVWLLLGALIGRALGLVGWLNFSFWYFASPSALIGWQIIVAIVCALFYSFLMTSRTTPHTKGALLGLGVCFAIALYGGEIWASMQAGRSPGGLIGMPAGEGIFFEWILIHSAWFGVIVGWIIGALISRGHRKAAIISEEANGST